MAGAFVAGAVVAAVGTPAGVSGAVFLLPVQITVLGVSGPAVSATNLLFNIISTPLSLRRLARRSADLARIQALIAVGAVAAVGGALTRVTVLADPSTFRLLIAVVLLPVGIRLLWRAASTPPTTDRTAGSKSVPGLVALIVVGAAAAAIGGILGIGGGSLLAPALVAFWRYPVRHAATLGLTTTLTTSVAGLLAYTFFDAADIGAAPAAPFWDIGIALGLGGIIGGMVGATVQTRIDERVLEAVLGLLAAATALCYVARS
ncbi:hypothetical protein DFJ67_7028 [Asanoa ferruginea]|uniref:Probable membrane transporter protein n=1 Tax=Asanoa ferruginea TaxID=53367 RepID=A0A3D9ZU93_9ACTN|nr:TSUP family transporter [Asanoa ferruginea]REG00957.1 hypothetical protein DFJ67_7028 [Asanoa ferruginea]